METTVAAKITQFFANYPKQTYAKGQMILMAHDNPAHIIHLESGRVRQYDISHKGDEVVLNTFKPPAFFPMNWALNETPNVYFLQAEEDCVAHLAPPAEVTNFLKANPDVMYDLLQRLYRGTDGLLGRMVYLMSGSARSRLIYELVIECRRFGAPHTQSSYQLTINEQALGARAGLTRETVNREIHHLKDEGLLNVTRQSIDITDLSKLEAALGQEI